MKWLWTKDLRVNTVHITDVTKALWAIADWYAVKKQSNWDAKTMGKVPIFNVVDHGQTSQGTMAEIIGSCSSFVQLVNILCEKNSSSPVSLSVQSLHFRLTLLPATILCECRNRSCLALIPW